MRLQSHLAFFGSNVFVSFTRFWADLSSQQSLTQILDSTGNVVQALQPDSDFLRFDTTVLQVNGVTDPRGYGGATLAGFDLSLASVPLTNSFATFLLHDQTERGF